MKVLLLGLSKLKYMPYSRFFIDTLCRDGNDVHIVVWDRDGLEDSPAPQGVTVHTFRRTQLDEVSKYGKIFSYLKYRVFASRLIKDGGFDSLVLFHTMAGVVLYNTVINRYRGKYILEYLDFSHERNFIYNRAVRGLVKNSAYTFVSSDAFRKMLPDFSGIRTIHNISADLLENRDARRAAGSRQRDVIRLAFWGIIRDEQANLAVIDALAGDGRFELNYYGREENIALSLKEHCKSIGADNVFFHGSYMQSQRIEFAANTDIIHSYYDNSEATMMAIGNKYYDSMALYLPILCHKGSNMGDMVCDKGTGIALEASEPGFADSLYEYYRGIDWAQLEKSCDRELEAVMADMDARCRELTEFGKNKGK